LEKQSASVYKKQMFTYYGAVSNVEGIGFLGFRGTMRTNWYNDLISPISTISRNDISLRGANVENYSVLNFGYIAGPSPSNYITKSLISYESALLPNKVYKLKNTISKQFNGLEDTSNETTAIYDDNNFVTQSITLTKQAGITQQTTTTNIDYAAIVTTPNYVVGRPIHKTQSNVVTGDTMTLEEQYTYDGGGLLTKIKKKGHNTNFITEDNVYDAFGNIINKTVSASGLSSRITNYEYDGSGRFLTKSTDIEGLSTTFAYNTATGLLTSETNPYGLTSIYTYDSWFKKIKATDYLGKSLTTSFVKNGGNTIITTVGDDGNATEEVFDDLGRKTRSGAKDIAGSYSYVSYLYDSVDRNTKVSEPYFGLSSTQWNESQYDSYGRTIKKIAFSGKMSNISYTGLVTKVDDGTKIKESTKNSLGNVTSMKDIPGGTINYTYFANGNLKSSDYDGVVTTIEQDGWGRKTKLTDPSAGVYTYSYNDFGEALTATTPNGTTTYTLDAATGKLINKTVVGANTNTTTNYSYDGTSKLLNSSTYVDALENNATTITVYVYDSNKRVVSSTETTPYATFTRQLSYDAFGRMNTETSIANAAGYTSAKTVQHTYKNGQPWQIIDAATSQVLWQTNTVNARGQLTTATMSDGNIAITNTYDQFGFPSQFKHDRIVTAPGNVMTLNTVFDPLRGNLSSRTNSLFNWSESFIFDPLDRLTSFKNTTGATETQSYDDRGRITENAVGTYAYTNNAKAYQNTSVALTPPALAYYSNRPELNITYNAFKSPYQIEEEGVDKVSFTYNDDNSRSTMFYGGLQENKMQRQFRKYYSADGSMEIKQNMGNGVVEFITYIGGDGYTAPLVLKSDGTTQNYLYLHRDYQGSIVAISDATGQVLEKRLFDAWGTVLVQDGAGNTLIGLTILDRGYTGHEHLQTVGLIHMNGRLYDAKLHRFLQPDNYVQEPFNTQNYNRYGYCWNNPLKFSDPNGEFIWILVGAVIGGTINWIAHGAQFNAKGLTAFGIGAVAGGLATIIGPIAFTAAGGGAAGVGGFLAGAAGASAGAFASQAILSFGNHFAFGDPLLSGKDFIKGIAFAALTGGVINGGVALYNGRTFLTGANIAVKPISIQPAGLIKTGNEQNIKTDAKLPNTAQSSTSPTTQSNTTSKVTFTKNLDGNGYKVDGLGIAKTPVGSQSDYMNAIGNNQSATIDGINYSGHALDQMQGRGILSPTVVKDAIINSLQILPGNTPNTFMHIGNNGLRVILNSSGKVITVY
jgi:RHS repeat-associated protein